MPEAAIEAIAVSMMEGGYIEAGMYVMGNSAMISTAITTVAALGYSQYQSKAAASAAKSAFNASLKDRYTMVRSALEPRTLVLGRQRVSGPIAYVGSYGPLKEHIAYVVPLAGHEIDAVEAVYLGDEQVIINSDGNVTGIRRRETFAISTTSGTYTLTAKARQGSITASVQYGSTNQIITVTGTTDTATATVVTVTGASGAIGTLTLTYEPDPCPYVLTPDAQAYADITLVNGAGSVTVQAPPKGGNAWLAGSYISNGGITVTGNVISITGVVDSADQPVSGVIQVAYAPSVSKYLINIKAYTGAPGQAADPSMLAVLPEVWTSAHKFTGTPYLRVMCLYDKDAFPGGIPQVSALVRGAKVLDPRTGVTAWSENPALLARHAALHPYCGNLPAAVVPAASVITAANVCDASVSYSAGGQTYSRAKYRASMVIRSGTRGADAIDALCAAMAGDWAFVDGELRLWAGAYVAPTLTIDESWLSDAGPIKFVPAQHRADVVNTITGTFADEQQDYKELPHPKVVASAYITADGKALPTNRPLTAVTFGPQAQQVQATWIRWQRQGQTVSLTLNERANQLEWRDTVYLTLDRYGQSAKPYIVMSITPSLADGHQVVLKEVSSTIWAMGTSFELVDPAPNTTLRSPLALPSPPAITLASAGQQLVLQDGTQIPRIKVTWPAIADQVITAPGGLVEVSYGLTTQPVTTWRIVSVPGSAVEAYLADVQDKLVYGVRVRVSSGLVAGAWGNVSVHRVIGYGSPVDGGTFAANLLMNGSHADRVGATNQPAGLDIYVNGQQSGGVWAWADSVGADGTGKCCSLSVVSAAAFVAGGRFGIQSFGAHLHGRVQGGVAQGWKPGLTYLVSYKTRVVKTGSAVADQTVTFSAAAAGSSDAVVAMASIAPTAPTVAPTLVFRGQTGATSGTTLDSGSFASSGGAGSLLYVAAVTTGATPTLADNKGNAYTKLSSAARGNGAVLTVWRCSAFAGGAGHIVTVSGTGGMAALDVLEVTGGTVDHETAAALDSAAPFGASVVAGGAGNRLILAWCTSGVTDPGGWTAHTPGANAVSYWALHSYSQTTAYAGGGAGGEQASEWEGYRPSLIWNVAPSNASGTPAAIQDLSSQTISYVWRTYHHIVTMGATVEPDGSMYIGINNGAGTMAALSAGCRVEIDDRMCTLWEGASAPTIGDFPAFDQAIEDLLRETNTGMLAPGSATVVAVADVTTATITAVGHTPDGFAWNTSLIQVTVPASATAGMTGYVSVAVHASASYVMTAAVPYGDAIRASIQDDNATFNGWNSFDVTSVASGLTDKGNINRTQAFTIEAGTAHTFSLRGHTIFGSSNTFENLQMRAEVLKR